jgi:hypothetical protein
MMMSSARQQDNEPLAEYYKRFTSAWKEEAKSPFMMKKYEKIQ